MEALTGVFPGMEIVTAARRIRPEVEATNKPSAQSHVFQSNQEGEDKCMSRDARKPKTPMEEKKSWLALSPSSYSSVTEFLARGFGDRYSKKATSGPDYGPPNPRTPISISSRRLGGCPTPINRLGNDERYNPSQKLVTSARHSQRDDHHRKRRKVNIGSSSRPSIDLERLSERTNSISREQPYSSKPSISLNKSHSQPVPEYYKVDETVRIKKRSRNKKSILTTDTRPTKLQRAKYTAESGLRENKRALYIGENPADPIEDKDREFEMMATPVSSLTHPGNFKSVPESSRQELISSKPLLIDSPPTKSLGDQISPYFKSNKIHKPDESLDEISASHFQRTPNKKHSKSFLINISQREKDLAKPIFLTSSPKFSNVLPHSDENISMKKPDTSAKTGSSRLSIKTKSSRVETYPILQVFCTSKLWLLLSSEETDLEKTWKLHVSCVTKSLTICDETGTPVPGLELGRVNKIDCFHGLDKLLIHKPSSTQASTGAHQIYIKLKNSDEGKRFRKKLQECDPNVQINLKNEPDRFEKILEKAQKMIKARTKTAESWNTPFNRAIKEAIEISPTNSEDGIRKDDPEKNTLAQDFSSKSRGLAKSMKTRSQTNPVENLTIVETTAASAHSSPQRSTGNGQNLENPLSTRLFRPRLAKANSIALINRRSNTPEPKKWTKLNPSWTQHWRVSIVYPREGKNKATVDREDIERLDEGEFLNDNLVMFYLRWLQNKVEQDSPEIAKRVYFHNTFFYERLTKISNGKTGFNYDNVSRWTAKVNLLEYDYIVVPINENLHWYVAIICNAPKLLEKCDISPTSKYPNKTEENIIEISKDVECIGSPKLSTRDSVSHAPGLEVSTKMKEMSLNDPTKEIGNSEPDPILLENSDIESPSISITRKKRRKSEQLRQDLLKQKLSEPRIITLDSLSHAHSLTCTNLKKYLLKEIETKLNKTIEDPGNLGRTAKNIPQQDNLSDCGLFVLGYIQKFLCNPDKFISHLLLNNFPDDTSWPKPSEMRVLIRRLLFHLQKENLEAAEKLEHENSKDDSDAEIREEKPEQRVSPKERKSAKKSPQLEPSTTGDQSVQSQVDVSRSIELLATPIR